jgi:hypothetical protein
MSIFRYTSHTPTSLGLVDYAWGDLVIGSRGTHRQVSVYKAQRPTLVKPKVLHRCTF